MGKDWSGQNYLGEGKRQCTFDGKNCIFLDVCYFFKIFSNGSQMRQKALENKSCLRKLVGNCIESILKLSNIFFLTIWLIPNKKTTFLGKKMKKNVKNLLKDIFITSKPLRFLLILILLLNTMNQLIRTFSMRIFTSQAFSTPLY